MKNRGRQIFLVILGQVIISMGLALMLVANLGVDPQSVFHTGVSNVLNVSFGTAIFIENSIIIFLVYLIDKKYINVATLLSLFIVSITSTPFYNMFVYFFGFNLSILVSVMLLVASCIIFSLGLNLYILADLGVGAMDAFSEILTNRTLKSYRTVKVLTDFVFLIVGWLLGGSIGIGTIIASLLIGPTIQFQRNLLSEKLINFITK